MYIVNNLISVTWPLGATNKLVVQSDLDVIVIDADGAATYNVDPLTSFTAPTSTTNGSCTFTFTPTQHGEYLVKLVSGTSSSYITIDEFDLPVRRSLPQKSLTHDVRVLATKSITPWKLALEVKLTGQLLPSWIRERTIRVSPSSDVILVGSLNSGNTDGRLWRYSKADIDTFTGTDITSILPGYPQYTSSQHFRGMWNNGDTWVVSRGDGTWTSRDNTQTWTNTPLPSGTNFSGLYYHEAWGVWLGGTNGQGFLVSEDDALTWSIQYPAGIASNVGWSNSRADTHVFTFKGETYCFGIASAQYFHTPNSVWSVNNWFLERIDVTNNTMNIYSPVAASPNEIVQFDHASDFVYRSTDGLNWSKTATAPISVANNGAMLDWSEAHNAFLLKSQLGGTWYISPDGIEWEPYNEFPAGIYAGHHIGKNFWYGTYSPTGIWVYA